MKKKGGYHSNQPGVVHAVSEADNPKNKPVMGKGPVREAPHFAKAAPVVSEPKGRKARRRARAESIISKARKGR